MQLSLLLSVCADIDNYVYLLTIHYSYNLFKTYGFFVVNKKKCVSMLHSTQLYRSICTHSTRKYKNIFWRTMRKWYFRASSKPLCWRQTLEYSNVFDWLDRHLYILWIIHCFQLPDKLHLAKVSDKNKSCKSLVIAYSISIIKLCDWCTCKHKQNYHSYIKRLYSTIRHLPDVSWNGENKWQRSIDMFILGSADI